VQEPAQFTLPVSAQNVLILNGAVAQPEDDGIERTFNGQSLPVNYPLSLDSTVWSAIDEIAGVLNDSHFFKGIAVYNKPLRRDTEWVSTFGISPKLQSDFYNAENYDALFVVHRLLFAVKENVKKMPEIFSSPDWMTAFINLHIEGTITCSMYSYVNEKPLITFNMTDSLIIKSVFDGDSLFFFKDIPEDALHELARELGNQAATHFIPTWKTVDRIIFTGYNARMQEATSYATSRKWETAESLWNIEFVKKTKPVDRAKVAFNLAVANEMQDKLDTALDWVQKAKEQLGNDKKYNDSQEMNFTNKYISELEQRIQNNHLLDLQWGKE